MGGACRRDGGAASEDVHRPGDWAALCSRRGRATFEVQVVRQASCAEGDLSGNVITQLEEDDPLQTGLTSVSSISSAGGGFRVRFNRGQDVFFYMCCGVGTRCYQYVYIVLNRRECLKLCNVWGRTRQWPCK